MPHRLAGSPATVYRTDGKPDARDAEAVVGMTIERNALVRRAAVPFDLGRSNALTRSDSRDLILKVAEERWNI